MRTLERFHRRIVAAAALVLAVLPAITVPAIAADAYPAKPLRMVVPFAPGGGTDVLARLVSTQLAQRLGQPVVIENRPGAGTMLATEMVAKAPADGYTILVVSASHALNPSLYGNVRYDPLKDFKAITLGTAFPFIVAVHPTVPARTMPELIALARSKPGTLGYASSGIGATNHLAGEMFKSQAGVNLIHVPYKGGGPALTDTIGGQVPILFGTIIETLPAIKADRLRGLAVTSARRSSLAPDVPTIAEAGVPGYDVTGWYGFVVATGTPDDVIDRLNREITAILRAPETVSRLEGAGATPTPTRPDEAQDFIAKEITRWGKLIREANIKAE